MYRIQNNKIFNYGPQLMAKSVNHFRQAIKIMSEQQ